MRPRLLAALLLVSLSVPAGVVARAQQGQLPPGDNPGHPTSTPYTGPLNVFESPERDAELQPMRILKLLGVHAGSSVADIGAGGGWLTVRAARAVGPDGVVYAEDINPRAIDTIRARAEQEHLPQVHVVLGTPDDPKLPPNSVDAAVMLESYHEFADAQALLRHLTPALRPGARIGIVDRNGDGADHGLNEPVLVQELAKAGFRRVGRYDFVQAAGQSYFLIFTRK